MASGKQSKSWSKSAGKGKSEDGKGQGDGTFKAKYQGSLSVKGSYKSIISKTGMSGLGSPKLRNLRRRIPTTIQLLMTLGLMMAGV